MHFSEKHAHSKCPFRRVNARSKFWLILRGAIYFFTKYRVMASSSQGKHLISKTHKRAAFLLPQGRKSRSRMRFFRRVLLPQKTNYKLFLLFIQRKRDKESLVTAHDLQHDSAFLFGVLLNDLCKVFRCLYFFKVCA